MCLERATHRCIVAIQDCKVELLKLTEKRSPEAIDRMVAEIHNSDDETNNPRRLRDAG